MPALKMKSKPSARCSEGKGLHACHKSSKISKNSCSQVRISQHAAELDTSLNHHDVFPNIEASKEIECDDISYREKKLDGETCQFRKLSLSVAESPPVERTEFVPAAACSSDWGTIFSPIFDSNEFNPDIHKFEGDDRDDGSNSLCDYQTCNVSDFHISDMTVPGLPLDRNIGFDDIIEANPFPDYECTDLDMMFDMAERYMILPFLEETVESSNIILDDTPRGEALTNSDNGCLYIEVHQMKSCDQESDTNFHSGDSDEADCFDPYLFLGNLPDLSDVVPSLCPMLLPKETRKRKPVTLVLDLDETLVHSSLEHCDDADFTFPVFFNMKEHTVYVRQRPYLQTFLERVAEMFEIIVFTASQSSYAEQLLNILDPDGKLISQRAYRESCIFSEGNYTKDLTVLGVDLAKVAIIDNSPQVFRLQVNNGIPIKSWFDDPTDRALISLLPFLETLADADDVRPIIANRYSNKD